MRTQLHGRTQYAHLKDKSAMESQYIVEKHDAFIWVTYHKGSVINDQSITTALEELNMGFDMTLWNAVWDFRQCIPSEPFGYKEIYNIMNYIEKEKRIPWSPKVAILVDTELQYGLSRIFQLLASEKSSQVEIFKETREALQWVTH